MGEIQTQCAHGNEIEQGNSGVPETLNDHPKDIRASDDIRIIRGGDGRVRNLESKVEEMVNNKCPYQKPCPYYIF